MTKKILVTGGAGFIGSNTIKLLMEVGWSIICVDDFSAGDALRLKALNPTYCPPGASSQFITQNLFSKKLIVMTSDFANQTVLDMILEKNFAAVIHCAANPSVPMSVKYPIETFENNVYKTQILAIACAKSKTRLVFSSSSAVYGDTANFPTDEFDKCNPVSPYGLQKLQCEQLIQLYSKLYKLDAYCLRYFNVYGPGQDGASGYCTLIARWCESVKSGTAAIIEGSGEAKRDFIYVGDVAKANVMAALTPNKSQNYPINICSGKAYSINEIQKKFINRQPYHIFSREYDRIGDAKMTLGNPSRAKNLLDFQADVELDEGLKCTFESWGI